MKVVDKNMDNDLNNPNRDNIEKTLKYMKFEMCAR